MRILISTPAPHLWSEHVSADCFDFVKDTRCLLNSTALAAVKRRAVLINIGRGEIIDDTALEAALDSGQIEHAFPDVFHREPLPPEAPWWHHPQVTVTPHISGCMPPTEVAKLHAALLHANLDRLAAGLAPFNKVLRR